MTSLLICLPNSFGADDISVKAELDQAFITIGDPVEYTVTATHIPEIQILTTVPSPDSEVLKIKKIEELKRQQGGYVVEGRKFKLTTYKLGEFILDPVTIEYRAKDGTVKSLATNRLYLTVKSVAEGVEKKDIRGIKSVLGIKSESAWLLILFLILALSAVGFLIYQKMRRKVDTGQAPAALLSPEDEALQALNSLFDSDLIRRGRVKDYYLKFSEILRTYFEKRFSILAIESTTYEIILGLKNKEVPPELTRLIQEALEAADLAKFAKWKPEPIEMIQLNKKAKQIIEEARPKEVSKEVHNGV